MRMTYEQAYEDHCYLWAIDDAMDMTGGYVDQKDLALLLKSPTKATAKACLCSQIRYWFAMGIEGRESVESIMARDEEVYRIAERHGVI